MSDRIRRRTPKSAARRVPMSRSDGATQGHRAGDKVRIKSGAHAGIRAVLAKVSRNLLIAVVDGVDTLMVPPDSVTNFSLAARKAWAVMPKRSGRPPAAHPPKRMVSLRLDIELLSRLDEAVRSGAVENRSQGITSLVNAGLDRLGVPKAGNVLTQIEAENNSLTRRRSRG
jgi:Arc/MetJ-type ribon-helix-helix transcriptional regulator